MAIRFFSAMCGVVAVLSLSSCFLSDWGTDLGDFVEKGLSVAYVDSWTVSQSGAACAFVVPGAEASVSVRLCNAKGLDLDYTLGCADGSYITDAALPSISSTAGSTDGYTTVSFSFTPSAAADLQSIVFSLGLYCPSLNKTLQAASIAVYCDSPPEAPSVFKVGKYDTGFPFVAFALPEDGVNADIAGVEVVYWPTASGETAAITYASEVSRSGSELTTGTSPELLDSNMKYRRYFIPTGTTTNGYAFRLRLKDKNAQYSPWTSDLSISATSHILTFNSNASDASGTVGITFGNQGDQCTLSDGKSYTRSGWAFEFWNTSADGTGTSYAGGATYTMGSSNATLYVHWIETGNISITLSFSSYGSLGATVDSSSVPRGSIITCTGTPSLITAASWAWYLDGALQLTATSAVFAWNTSSASVGEHIISCTAVGTDGIGYSTSTKVSVAPASTVTYSGNGATSLSTATQSFISGGSVSIADGSAITRPGYTFVNWNTKADGSGTAYAVGATYSTLANLVLYAQWRLTTPVAVTALKSSACDSKVTLSWTAPAAIADLDHYEITWKRDVSAASPDNYEDAGTFTPIPAGTLKYTITGLFNYTQHGFDVKAVYREPTGSSAPAGSATATIYAIPGAGAATLYTLGRNVLAFSYVPAKTVYTGGDTTTETPIAGYLMAQTETTYQLWYDVWQWAILHGYTFAHMGAQGSSGTAGAVPTDTEPVTTISRRDAIVWCNALTEYCNAVLGTNLSCVYYLDSSYAVPLRASTSSSTIERSTPGTQDNPYILSSSKGFRLPTNAEWECAARYISDFDGDGAITTTGEFYPKDNASGADREGIKIPTVDYDNDGDMDDANAVAWSGNNSNGSTQNAATKKPNRLGLYDMSGNVAELTINWYSTTTSNYTVPIWGGVYGQYVFTCITNTNLPSPLSSVTTTGFRVVRNAQ